MKYSITNWNASPSKLIITVTAEPLSMAKTYVRAFYGTNVYGQDRRWSWWHVNGDNNPTSEVFGEETRLLLDSLVVEHDALGLLIERYHISKGEG